MLPRPSVDSSLTSPPAIIDMLAHHGQAHPAAFHLVPGLEGLEHLEDLFVVLGRNPGTVVLDAEATTLRPDLRRKLQCGRLLVVMLDGVRDQIDENLLQRHAENLDAGETSV